MLVTKTCSKCKIEQDIKYFSKNKGSKDGFAYQCRTCLIKYRNNKTPEQKERYRQTSKLHRISYNKTDKGVIVYEKNKLNLKLKRFGISLSEYNNLIIKQDNKCAICKKGFLSNNTLGKALAIDHCHISNKVRGLLCTNCNMGLGHFKDNQEFLQEACLYLKNYSDAFITD